MSQSESDTFSVPKYSLCLAPMCFPLDSRVKLTVISSPPRLLLQKELISLFFWSRTINWVGSSSDEILQVNLLSST